jgi:hypothetical protein
MNYYYSIDGTEVVGPHSLDDLKSEFFSGSLLPTTQVCAEGTETWQTLATLVNPSPKQVAQSHPIPQQVHRHQTTHPSTVQARKNQYGVKVLTTKDRAFGGKFDPEKLESALNSYASEGWTVAGCDSAEFPGFLGARSELITVMHRTGGCMKKYKILTQKDRFFGGKFDPEKLESAINSYVPEGWQVRAVTTASFPGFGSSREEMIVVLEKEV